MTYEPDFITALVCLAQLSTLESSSFQAEKGLSKYLVLEILKWRCQRLDVETVCVQRKSLTCHWAQVPACLPGNNKSKLKTQFPHSPSASQTQQLSWRTVPGWENTQEFLPLQTKCLYLRGACTVAEEPRWFKPPPPYFYVGLGWNDNWDIFKKGPDC